MGGMIFTSEGLYIEDIDGKRSYHPPQRVAVEIDNEEREIVLYDPEKGVLRVDVSEGDLERLVSTAGQIPPSGTTIELPSPSGGVLHYEHVKKIERIVQEGEPHIKIGIETRKKGVLQKVRESLSRYLSRYLSRRK